MGTQAKAVIDDLQSEMVLPMIALAKAAYIVERGRTSIPDVSQLFGSVKSDARIEIFPLTLEVLESSQSVKNIPEMHDRLIVGTAFYLQSLGHIASVLTKDSIITGAQIVPIIW